jgi:hypothetical protein
MSDRCEPPEHLRLDNEALRAELRACVRMGVEMSDALRRISEGAPMPATIARAALHRAKEAGV